MKTLCAVTMALAGAMIPALVRAADKWYLDPPADWYWHTAANWGGTPAGLPTASTSVSITRTRETTPVQILPGEAFTVKSLALGESNQGADYCGTLQVAGTLASATWLQVGGGGSGLLRVQEGAEVRVAEAVAIGSDTGVRGTVVMTNGSLWAGDYIRLGQQGTGCVVQVGGSVAATNGQAFLGIGFGSAASGVYTNVGGAVVTTNLSLGVDGRGDFVQEGGSVTAFGYLCAGYGAGSSGRYLNCGGDLIVRGAGRIGERGAGLMEQESGTNAFAAALQLGQYAGGDGRYVNRGGRLTVSGECQVGGPGTALMKQEGGVNVFNNRLYLGFNAGGSGCFTNAGGRLETKSVFYVGYSGTGEYVQTGGTNTLSDWLSIGRNAGSAGRYVLENGFAGLEARPNQWESWIQVGRSGHGELELRGGTVGMAARTVLNVRGEESGAGILRGWGAFPCADTTPYVLNNGLVVADGEGEARDLSLTDFIYATNSIPNGADGMNGWYAVNKGRLLYPRAWIAASVPERGIGDAHSDAANDLVNSIHLSFTGITAQGSEDLLRAELYATDRDDIPPGLPTHGDAKILGVWRLPMPVTFGTATLRFRYDRTGVKTDDRIRLYRGGSAGGWQRVGTATGADEAVAPDAALVPLPQADGYLGWFAVAAFPNVGTLITVQ